jgi:predicted alpha/beta-hydrolase family hydrolase
MMVAVSMPDMLAGGRASSAVTASRTLRGMHVVLAHGASGSAASMQAHVDGLVRLCLDATAIDLPLRRAEAAVPVYRERARALGRPDELAIGGQSYGGRVASLLAAEEDGFGALLCFSYPLHRPGRPEWQPRTTHWPDLHLPVLLLSGEADPFARLDLLRLAVAERLPRARLVTFPGQGHSLRPVLDEALDVAAAFVRDLAAPPAVA